MSEFIRKIYLDSRYRLSGTTSDYEIELPRTVTVAKNALGWITDLHLPVSWYNIDQHNNRLYVLTSAFVSTNVQTRAYVVDVTPGNYTAESLAAALRRNLNAAATASFPLQVLFQTLFGLSTITRKTVTLVYFSASMQTLQEPTAEATL